MARTTKFIITLDTAQFEEIKGLVASGQVASVSAYVKKAIQTALDDDKDWEQTLKEMLDATGGPMTAAEREWADAALGYTTPATPKKRRRA